MMDSVFKLLYGHPAVVKILIRHMMREDVERIDLSTLEKLDSELIGDAFVRRYPDMVWTARTRDGTGTVVFPIRVPGPGGPAHGPSDDDLRSPCGAAAA